MKETNIVTSSGKKIDVFEGVFTYIERSKIEDFIFNSVFKVTGGDYINRDYQTYASYNYNDLENMGLFDSEGFQLLDDRYNLTKGKLVQARVNFSYPMEKNRVHEDDYCTTFLYYANLDWHVSWAGHTMFFDDELENVEYTSLYKPGKVVIFDGTIPHMILSPSILADKPRLSFALQVQT